jgi:predicted outer membrane repeat protein
MSTKRPKHVALRATQVKPRTSKANSSAFVKPSLKTGMAFLGASGLVLGMGVVVTNSASATTAPFACNPGNTAVAGDTLEGNGGDLAEIQDTFASLDPIEGVVKVCLDGEFDLGDGPEGIVFDENVHFFGVENSTFGVWNTSIEGGFFNSESDDSYSITIENLSITDSTTTPITALNVEVIDSNFSNNQGSLGGAIVAYGTVNVTDSTFIDNSSALSGGAIYSEAPDSDGPTVVVSNSKFSGNSAEFGGAIWAVGLQVESSTFENNTSLGYIDEDEEVDNETSGGRGGAIMGFTVEVSNSTFKNNNAFGYFEEEEEIDNDTLGGLGGAIWGVAVEVSNSTFLENSVLGEGSEGGAMYATEGSVYFSTFVNNLASTPPAEPGDTPGNAIYKSGGSLFSLSANIFAGSSLYPQLGFGVSQDEFVDYGGNVFSTSAATETDIIQDPSSVFEASLTALFGTETPALATHAPNTNGTQTIALVAGSPAIDVVPFEVTETVDPQFDQRGAARTHPADAGAFEGVVALTIDGPTGGAYVPPADFTVLTFPTGVTTPGTDVKVSGLKLKLVKAVYVNGVKVKIQTQRPRSITFATPRGLTGLVDVRFVSAKGEYTAIKALDFGPSVVAGANAQTVVGGFAANSTRLSVKMKREIRAFLRANPELDIVVCTGFTSLPATVRDAALSKARGQVTCDFVKKLNPDLTVKVMQGRHTERPGSQIRRVRITLQ